MESLVDLLGRGSRFPHIAVALTLPDRPSDDLPHLLRGQFTGEGRIGFLAVLSVEGRLQELRHMAIDALLGIALHPRVDGSEDLQAIGIYIVERTVLLGVFLAPSTEWVRGESDGVDDILSLVP